MFICAHMRAGSGETEHLCRWRIAAAKLSNMCQDQFPSKIRREKNPTILWTQVKLMLEKKSLSSKGFIQNSRQWGSQGFFTLRTTDGKQVFVSWSTDYSARFEFCQRISVWFERRRYRVKKRTNRLTSEWSLLPPTPPPPHPASSAYHNTVVYYRFLSAVYSAHVL